MPREMDEFFEFSPDAILSLDHDMRIALFNPAAERLFGYTVAEIIGQSLDLLLPEEARLKHLRLVDGFRKAPERDFQVPRRKPLLGRMRDGTTKPLDISIQKHPSGSRYQFTAICRDASSIAAVNEELAASEARLARAQAIAHIGNWEWNIATGDLAWSDEIYQIFGRRPQEFEPTSEAFLETIHPDDRQRVSLAIDNAVNNMAPYSIEHRIVSPDGEEKVVQEIGLVQRDPEGEAIRIDGTVQDITQTWKTTQELIAATRSAQEANRAKSDFLSSMSHELRTPLNAVLGFAQMLQSDGQNPLSEKQVEYLQYILDGGHHLLELINQVLDLARIEANRIDLSLEDLAINETVAECVALAIPLAKPQGLKVIDELSGGPTIYLHTDQMRFRQVLINLLSNAIKYNQPGGTVTISCKKMGYNFARISVKDTGIGIAKKDREKVFQMFNRLGTAADLGKEGTGIGLYVAKGLVEKMAGRMGFKSEEGAGSTFWIELPSPANDTALHWDSDLNIGVDAIDKDHQVIFSLCNKLSHAPVDDLTLDGVIADLINHTRYHFAREEAIMEICGVPDLHAHRRQHLSLASEINDLATTWYNSHDPQILQNLRAFIGARLIEHIKTADIKIADHTVNKAPEIKQALDDLA